MLSVAFSTLQSVNKMQAAVSTSKSAKLFFSTKILKKKNLSQFLPLFSFLIIAIRGSDCTRIFSAHTQTHTEVHALVGEEERNCNVLCIVTECLPIIKGNL